MIIARVIGSAVSTIKVDSLHGSKLLIVQRASTSDELEGDPFVAVDAIGRTLFQRDIVVTGGSTGSVRVWRGAQATEMACGASCAPSVRTAGDSGAARSTAP